MLTWGFIAMYNIGFQQTDVLAVISGTTTQIGETYLNLNEWWNFDWTLSRYQAINVKKKLLEKFNFFHPKYKIEGRIFTLFHQICNTYK